MGIRILYDSDNAAMYSSTTDWAFGPVLSDDGVHDASERLDLFIEYLRPRDPRSFSDSELEAKYIEWRSQEAAQWKAKEDEEK
jgi:hypothetical protein